MKKEITRMFLFLGLGIVIVSCFKGNLAPVGTGVIFIIIAILINF